MCYTDSMQKCTICQLGSWVVGLSAIGFAVCAWLGYALPTSMIAKVIYVMIVCIAASFLYYQIVPCPRCVAVNKKS